MRFSLLVACLLTTPLASADNYVRGHMKKDGTYVAPHYRTNQNSTRLDNYSTQGNTNPYTGQSGTKPLFDSTPTYKAPKLRY